VCECYLHGIIDGEIIVDEVRRKRKQFFARTSCVSELHPDNQDVRMRQGKHHQKNKIGQNESSIHTAIPSLLELGNSHDGSIERYAGDVYQVAGRV
jgi:hypothetical protein